MKKYREYILLILIICILSLLLILKKSDNIHYSLPTIPKMDADTVNQITIKNGQEEFTLKKIDNKWIIDNYKYKVDSKKMNYILSDLNKLKLVSLISTKKDFKRYSVDEENGIKITVNLKNGENFSFIIGKLGPNYSSTYLKLDKEQNIYLAQGNLRLTFDTNVDELRNKVIFSYNKDSVKSIRIKNNNVIEIKKIDSKWMIDNKEVSTKNTIKSLLDNLYNLECESYLNNKFDNKEYKIRLIVQLQDDLKTHHLEIFEKTSGKEKKYIGKSNEVEEYFVLTDYKVEELIKLIEKL